jgi:glutamine synthetase
MTAFAERCGAHDAARAEACARVLRAAAEAGVERVRIAWPDWHGQPRVKTITLDALPAALAEGIGLVGTLLLKDSADRTAVPVFDPAQGGVPDGLAFAGNVVLLPDPQRWCVLPHVPHTAWLPAVPHFADGRAVDFDPRAVLQGALAALAARGFTLKVGLELEFHVWRLLDEPRDPDAAAWPGPAPRVALLHPGYALLGEDHADRCDEVFAIVHRTCAGLGLPLTSLEVELGPSQLEAVFAPCDALVAADRLVLFRSAVRQALRRAGFHASFVCRPPFAQVMGSGWHLHQSLVDAQGRNAMAAGPGPATACGLSATGTRWLAGLQLHATAVAALAVPTVNGWSRFRPNTMAPTVACWGRDHRGALLRVLGTPGDTASRIENRLAEPAANPYLAIAAQVHAGLDGLARGLAPLPAGEGPPLPASLGAALDALADDAVVGTVGLGAAAVDLYTRIKRHELARHAAADDKIEWERREYFARL